MMFALAMALSGMGSDGIYASSLKIPQLADECAATADDPLATNLCVGYILGTLDTLVINHQVCPTDTKTLTLRALAIGRKVLADNATRTDVPPASLIGNALRNAFPCGTSA